MDQYKNFSKVYDLFSTNYNWCFKFIEEAIRDYADNPRSILELACGTGNILYHFAGKYEVSGLDISASLLEQARKKLPDVQLFQMNMADFSLASKYDVVLCMYDSINHILEYENWVKTFKCVRNHLNTQGIFVFDMNTIERLDRLAQSPGFLQQEADSYIAMRLTKKDKNITNWKVNIFQRVKYNLYEMSEDNIEETSFSPQKVEEDLKTLFSEVHLSNIDNDINMVRGRVFFICKT
ncbi:class I SAM-dependent DNA methyltransferase [Chloroflexota bacterium]